MNSRLQRLLPTLILGSAAIALIAHGPITQFAHYHDFADQRGWRGIPNATDVLSNLGFAAVGAWGLWRLWPRSDTTSTDAGWPGYRLFLLSLLLTAIGSAYYHWAPDDARLIWDRLPIALACAGLLAGVRAEVAPMGSARLTSILALAAVASVAWWYATGTDGQGDLRPYLLLQVAPLVLVPLWQWIYRAPRADRIAFGAAIALYVAAKMAELGDHQLFAQLHWISGHTLKHLLAAIAAAVIVARLVRRSVLTADARLPASPGDLYGESLRDLRIFCIRFRIPSGPR